MSSYVRKKTPGDTEWFVHDRFGMFIHFGTYSLSARHEWCKTKEFTPEHIYQRYFDHFNPDLYDAREWARKAKAAGMKYAVLTTKHHEGFCLFDTKYTDYNVMNTPYGKDIVREFVDAFRAEGLKVGFYYSVIDWHHPEFPIDQLHPRRNDPDAEEQDRGRDMKKYAEYMRNQLKELLTNYGKIDILWFDYSYPAKPDNPAWMQFGGGKLKEQWESEKLIEVARRLMPDIIINDRIDIPQDLSTPEQRQAGTWPRDKETGEYLTWETCHTFSNTWGYARDEHSWKTPKMLIDLLTRSVALGGNLIMNVGPTGRGNFDARADRALEVYADWIRLNGRSIYGCTMAEPEFEAPAGTVLTQSVDGKRLYIHLQDCQFKGFHFPTLAGKFTYMQLLNDASEVIYQENLKVYDAAGNLEDGSLFIRTPATANDLLAPVIEVFLK